MNIALAQINPIVGDFDYNAEKIIAYSKQAADLKADLVVFPEMALFGYPANDLLEREEKIREQIKALKKILTQLPKNITVIFGAVAINEDRNKKGGKPYLNVAVVAKKGKKPVLFSKQLLPSYDVFDETRFFEPGTKTGIVAVDKIGKVAVSICEDMWAAQPGVKRNYFKNPITGLKGAKLIVNISASPFAQHKHKTRLALARSHALENKIPFIYVNQVGGQDETVFDGQSFFVGKNGKVLVQAPAWQEDLTVFDATLTKSAGTPLVTNPTENLRQGIILGLRDFVRKTGNKKVHLGLSGGIDSAVVAALARDALGADNVTGFILPGPFNAPESQADAEALAHNLKIKTIVVNIEEAYELLSQMSEAFGLGRDEKKISIAHQNIQARLRGLIMMTYSNHTGSLLLSTGNKSEIAAGYCTLYGDMCGALVPLGDIVKGEVYALARLYNEAAEVIPKRIIERPPSAELAPHQKDQDTLPDYDVLDSAVKKLIEEKKVPQSDTETWLYRALARSEFKRWQAPPILRLTEHAFGRGRRLPIAAKI